MSFLTFDTLSADFQLWKQKGIELPLVEKPKTALDSLPASK